jgi:ADP-heptose:LPS heptosyltransferase
MAPIRQSEKKKAESFFEKVKARAKRKKTIVVCPVSRQPYKVLEPAKMAKLCSVLIAQGYYLFAIYGPGQKEQVAAVNECMGKEPVELIENKLSLREWMGVLQRCGAYVGVDGGHKHLAISAEIPTFTLYHNVPPFWHPPKLRSHSFLDLTPQGESSPTIEHVIQEVSQFLQQSV